MNGFLIANTADSMPLRMPIIRWTTMANALCSTACREAAKVLGIDAARQFALRSLDCILAQAWNPENGLGHVIACSDAQAGRTKLPGLLDDYAFAPCACLEAYEATSDL